MKPKVFIASSVAGLDIAYPIQTNLQHDADVTIWSQGVFFLSVTPLDSLTEVMNSSDFGIFVFSPDDEIKMRGEISTAVRDNVIFELGLFIGSLGKRRCFIVMPDNVDFHIPTDLVGISPAKYAGGREISEITATLGPACHEIRQAIKLQGIKSARSLPTGKIPSSDQENYDENDKIVLLDAWLKNEAISGVAINYKDVDNSLKLELGSAKKLLPKVFERNETFVMNITGSNVFSLSLNTGYY
ncbi:MAG TPA: nucleotide-binding protein [Telluria sp.]